eukprot:gene3002-18761_t
MARNTAAEAPRRHACEPLPARCARCPPAGRAGVGEHWLLTRLNRHPVESAPELDRALHAALHSAAPRETPTPRAPPPPPQLQAAFESPSPCGVRWAGGVRVAPARTDAALPADAGARPARKSAAAVGTAHALRLRSLSRTPAALPA